MPINQAQFLKKFGGGHSRPGHAGGMKRKPPRPPTSSPLAGEGSGQAPSQDSFGRNSSGFPGAVPFGPSNQGPYDSDAG